MPIIKALPGIGPGYTSQFFVGDTVFYKDDPEKRAIVLRTWSTEEDDDFVGTNALDRPLLLGEVGLRVGFKGVLVIEPEGLFELQCRHAVSGYLVKRTVDSPEAAIVLSTHHEAQVEDAMTCERYDAWIPLDQMTSVARFWLGDKVVCGGWLGTVTLVSQVGHVIRSDGTTYDIHDTSEIMQVGDKVADIIDIYRGRGVHISTLYDYSHTDKVCAIAPQGIEVAWLANNQKIPHSEQWRYPPPQPWYAHSELDKLVRISKALDVCCQVHRSYIFKDERDYTQYGIEHRPAGDHAGETTALRVVRSRIKARLQWPDGHITEEWSNAVIPHENMDEHESWPGQHVLWTDESNVKRPAVVQTYDPVQRIVIIKLRDTAEIQIVSVLEVEHESESHSEFGAALGEHVFLCGHNGSPIPHVPEIGLAPGHTLDPIMLLGAAMGKSTLLPQDCDWAGARLEPNDVDWFGEVISLQMDGRLGVRLANGTTVIVELNNVLLLKVMEEGDAMDEDLGSVASNGSDYGAAMLPPSFPGSTSALVDIVLANNARRQRQSREADDGATDASWETAYSDEDSGQLGADLALLRQDRLAYEAGQLPWTTTSFGTHFMDIDSASEDADWVDESIEMAPSSPPTRQSRSPTPPLIPTPQPNAQAGPSSIPRSTAWEPFVVLDNAPSDHKFYGEAPASSSRARMKKINAEHKALRSSLPDNIVVRTYEDRLDLLRILIIGPEGTPYAGAPFVFDVFLNPNYPSQPPTVHFHSHTNGKGRCNPNLYEDGKVCLSILGTWVGDASESWDAERSSLLQVFVSISGLVLVRNPYHCEPAYAKLEGTKEGSVNSRLYSEKAYVLSRGFVKQALANPPEGLRDEIHHFYFTTGHLKEVVDHARALMEREANMDNGEEGGATWNADVIGSLTAGAKLSLKSLEKSLHDHQSPVL